MSSSMDAGKDIVWPDEDHLFDAESLSVEERVGSETVKGWNGLHRAEQDTERNESRAANDSLDLSSTNEYWDHDDRNTSSSNLRSPSPVKYAMSEEETDKWMHDKFNLLKIGPPPGLGVKRKSDPEAAQYGTSGHNGHFQQHQTSRRGQPSGARVLEVPRPLGQRPYQGLEGQKHSAAAQDSTFSQFPSDELRPATKTPWPEDVRGDDIEKWGWPEDPRPNADTDTWGWPDASASSTTSTKPSPSTADAAQVAEHVPKLSVIEQHKLRQVNQRNDEMAAIIAQLRSQEQVQYAGMHQQAFGPGSGPVSNGIRFSSPVSTMLGNPFQSQAQKPAGTVPYRLSNGALVPGHAMHQQASAVPTPTSPVARQSISHLFHSQMQPGQQSRPPVRPNQAPPPRQFVQPPVQAQLSRPLDRTGAGYVSGLRSQTRSRATDSVVYPLQPGHRKAAQTAMSGAPSPAVSLPGPSQPAMQPAKLPGLIRRESKPMAIVDPRTKPAADAEHVTATSGSTPVVGHRAGKRAVAIVDPESKKPLSLPAGATSSSHLARTDSSSSATSAAKPAKKLISIVDPNNKQPVQLPVKPLGTSRLARTNSNISAASSDSHQPVKRTIAIVDPQNKQPIELPDSVVQARQPSTADRQGASSSSASAASKRTKTPIAIVDPTTSAEVQLPAMNVSSTRASTVAAPKPGPGRMIRARKALTIVDPRTRADTAATPSAQPTAEAESSVIRLSLQVGDDEAVHCSLHAASEGLAANNHTAEKAGLAESGDSDSSAGTVVLKLVLNAAGTVGCSIVPCSDIAAGPEMTASPALDVNVQ